MIFDAETINRMKEQDVREEIIQPIISRLGYRFGTEYYAERERPLRHPYTQIGHKSSKDFPIGAADYICGIDGRRGSFVIDAKRGNRVLCVEDLIQTHSYAAHSEIGAHFFALCNGHKFEIFTTSEGVTSLPVISLINRDFERDFFKIEALLSPDNLMRYSKVKYDIGRPIANGFGSSALIKSGFLSYSNINYHVPNLPKGTFEALLDRIGKLEAFNATVSSVKGRRQLISNGQCFRDSNGQIRASIEFDSADEQFSYNLKVMGLSHFDFITDSQDISTNSGHPTVFESKTDHSIDKNIHIHKNLENGFGPIGVNTNFNIYYRTYGYVKNDHFIGNYTGSCLIVVPSAFSVVCDIEGSFDMIFLQ